MDYLQDFNQISQAMLQNLNSDEWIEIYLKLVNWDLELDVHPEIGLRQTFIDQKREANKEFSKFIEHNYREWINSTVEYDRPTLTVDILNKYLVDEIKNHDNVFLFVFSIMAER